VMEALSPPCRKLKASCKRTQGGGKFVEVPQLKGHLCTDVIERASCVKDLNEGLKVRDAVSEVIEVPFHVAIFTFSSIGGALLLMSSRLLMKPTLPSLPSRAEVCGHWFAARLSCTAQAFLAACVGCCDPLPSPEMSGLDQEMEEAGSGSGPLSRGALVPRPPPCRLARGRGAEGRGSTSGAPMEHGPVATARAPDTTPCTAGADGARGGP